MTETAAQRMSNRGSPLRGCPCEDCGGRFWPAEIHHTPGGSLCSSCLEKRACSRCGGMGLVVVEDERNGGQDAREVVCPVCEG